MQELATEDWRTSIESTKSNDNIPVLWGKSQYEYKVKSYNAV